MFWCSFLVSKLNKTIRFFFSKLSLYFCRNICASEINKYKLKKLKQLKSPITAYIGLGSNKGNRLELLQSAINLIFERLGTIKKVSKIYQTPALGFEGDDFLNACIKIKTRFSAATVLADLLAIEEDLGRKRSSQHYENRTLDLDLLFYEDSIINSENLTLPHPRLTKRKFVLEPLSEIAPKYIHPVLGKSILKLLDTTSDTSEIEIFPETLKTPELSFDNLSYLAVEGNIGAGKTSLATMVSQDFNAKLITERFKDNPFLPKFYKDQTRYGFPLEMSFLADRYQQLIEDIGQYDLFNDFVVADYDIYKSMIFAGVTLNEEENSLYKRLFQIMYKDLPKPDLYIYLYQDTARLLTNIKRRGRSYEQDIPAEYLEKINRGYLDFIKSQNHLEIKIIDVTELDFVSNRKDYLFLLREIFSS